MTVNTESRIDIPGTSSHFLDPTEPGDDGAGRLRYLTGGRGAPLLMLHTVRTQAEHFRRLIPLVEEHYTVYALDLPGMGYSQIVPGASYQEPAMRAAVKKLITQLDLRDVTLLGESMGAVLALTTAADRAAAEHGADQGGPGSWRSTPTTIPAESQGPVSWPGSSSPASSRPSPARCSPGWSPGQSCAPCSAAASPTRPPSGRTTWMNCSRSAAGLATRPSPALAGTRRSRPSSARFEPVRALRGFKTPVPRVLLSGPLTGHTLSGSANAPRLCQDCSRPARRLPGQAVLSSHRAAATARR